MVFANKKNKMRKNITYEFGGPLGVFIIIFLLPLSIYFIHITSTKVFKLTLQNISELPEILEKIKIDSFYSNSSMKFILIWFGINVFFERVLFAETQKGVKLSNGKQLKYRINGHLQFWAIIILLLFGNISFGSSNEVVSFSSFDLSFIYDNYIQLATSSIILSTILSVYLYCKSFFTKELLAEGGTSGNPIYDFFMGRELNPRIGSFDLKEFCELRPGLIGWMVINIGCAMKQKTMLGYFTDEMVLINIFQAHYVWDALYHEKAILSTMDITTDGFGYMLAFGDLAWVPFTYSLQARFLVENIGELDSVFGERKRFFLGFLVFLHFLGYTIFRGANSEKDLFRKDPDSDDVKHLKYLKTSNGRKLLISGWWGMARKINYTGDWLMSLSWCFLTGFSTPVTYFYSIYFAILLVHRALRDNHSCEKKYGQDWVKYKKIVPYMFIPKVF
eukprot:maker-scaffold_83-snap-gene-0.39-mRNA-1 protein AED:0.01 eAED:0.01 QI:69/1/1/1/0/0/2/271/446